MLTVKRELNVAVAQPQVWQFVKEMGNWASQMPGYLSHEQTNADDSVWTMQMNLGPFTRPIVMDVHVSEWLEPSTVNFTVKGRFDPFQGKGNFVSREAAGGGTDIVLDFDVEGTGSMAKVISAMAAPVLTTVADQFTANLKTALGGQEVVPAPVAEPAAPASLWRRLLTWLGLSAKPAP